MREPQVTTKNCRVFKNKKSGETYRILTSDAHNATNKNAGENLVIYCDSFGEVYAREWNEFHEKFEFVEQKETDQNSDESDPKPSFNGELIITLNSKDEWVRNIPRHLPEKNYYKEQFIWIDANGNTLVMGEDFAAAERIGSYPVKVYRHIRVSDAEKNVS